MRPAKPTGSGRGICALAHYRYQLAQAMSGRGGQGRRMATIQQPYARARQELGGMVGENETVKTVDAACQADRQWPRHLRTRALPLSARPSHEWSRWTRTMCALR